MGERLKPKADLFPLDLELLEVESFSDASNSFSWPLPGNSHFGQNIFKDDTNRKH